MEYVILFGVMMILIGFISWRWVVGIDYMQKNHPDYKGEDFLNWGDNKDKDNEEDKNQIM
jgi:hypothetical protein